MKRLSADFPPGLSYAIVYNPTEYVAASITEVEKTLVIAMVLVVDRDRGLPADLARGADPDPWPSPWP